MNPLTPTPKWGVVYTAYNQAGFKRIFKDVFCKGKKNTSMGNYYNSINGGGRSIEIESNEWVIR